ncbi:complex I intermediate-associated protein 30 (CIA30) [Roseicyclus mahoneyensis]|uniref:Complex I intermediate-associated protein 30 (CIA30) n=2 Tax=Roseicyclus mahoneyensis TaxID=164332 RepID=A0A316GYH9_9RHOB|nr:complex I intermediate-associated protein 30 (CIA30) [Roseicyclus mahoneyensis]
MTPATALDWSYLGDAVMGGVSQGMARIEAGALRLTGTVSTANRGGFIQARIALPGGLPEGATALRLRVRGNGERYFIHLRTTRTALPWQYYQQGFDTGPDWAEVVLPLTGFAASGRLMVGAVRPEEVRSVGLVAYGRDHVADVSLAALGAV